MSGLLLFMAVFVSMEGVSYGAHRWLMHGPGMGWHRSHHAPSEGGWERNDLFPACFSALGFALFLTAAVSRASWLYWLGAGVTAYGAAYLFVHEVYIHRRVGRRLPDLAYLRWLRAAHRDHHTSGAEPYGMLLPLRRSVADERARSTRLTRSRL
jgi:beta-carotene 3-hydroxylase